MQHIPYSGGILGQIVVFPRELRWCTLAIVVKQMYSWEINMRARHPPEIGRPKKWKEQFAWGPCRKSVPQAGSVRGNLLGAHAAGLCRRLANCLGPMPQGCAADWLRERQFAWGLAAGLCHGAVRRHLSCGGNARGGGALRARSSTPARRPRHSLTLCGRAASCLN